MAGDLPRAAIKHSEASHQIEQPLGSAEREYRAILRSYRPRLFGSQLIEIPAGIGKIARENGSGLWRCQGSVGGCGNILIPVLFIFPRLPKLARGPDCGITWRLTMRNWCGPGLSVWRGSRSPGSLDCRAPPLTGDGNTGWP
jgi:hypothetical protein